MEQIEIFEFEEMKNDPSGISIKRYIGTGSRRVAVPEEQDGKPVKQIAAKAFVQKDSQITELFLPECMENIMVGAFKGMQQLQGVNLPEGIVKISAACFEDCVSLNHIEFPKSLIGIDRDAFINCHGLEEVLLLGNIEKIGKRAFSYCTSLKRVELGDHVHQIGEGAFCSCSSLMSIKIPEGVKVIRRDTFANCLSLKYLELPYSLKRIEDGAFRGCMDLEHVILPPDRKKLFLRHFPVKCEIEELPPLPEEEKQDVEDELLDNEDGIWDEPQGSLQDVLSRVNRLLEEEMLSLEELEELEDLEDTEYTEDLEVEEESDEEVDEDFGEESDEEIDDDFGEESDEEVYDDFGEESEEVYDDFGEESGEEVYDDFGEESDEEVDDEQEYNEDDVPSQMEIESLLADLEKLNMEDLSQEDWKMQADTGKQEVELEQEDREELAQLEEWIAEFVNKTGQSDAEEEREVLEFEDEFEEDEEELEVPDLEDLIREGEKLGLNEWTEDAEDAEADTENELELPEEELEVPDLEDLIREGEKLGLNEWTEDAEDAEADTENELELPEVEPELPEDEPELRMPAYDPEDELAQQAMEFGLGESYEVPDLEDLIREGEKLGLNEWTEDAEDAEADTENELELPEAEFTFPEEEFEQPELDLEMPELELTLPESELELPEVEPELPEDEPELRMPAYDPEDELAQQAMEFGLGESYEVPDLEDLIREGEKLGLNEWTEDAEDAEADTENELELPEEEFTFPEEEFEQPELDLEMPELELTLPESELEQPEVEPELPKDEPELTLQPSVASPVQELPIADEVLDDLVEEKENGQLIFALLKESQIVEEVPLEVENEPELTDTVDVLEDASELEQIPEIEPTVQQETLPQARAVSSLYASSDLEKIFEHDRTFCTQGLQQISGQQGRPFICAMVELSILIEGESGRIPVIFSGNDIIFTYKEEMRRYNLLSGHKHSYPMGAIGAEQFCYSIADYAKANRPFTENSELFPWLLRRLLDVLDAGEQKKDTTELVHRINKCFLALRFPGIFCDLRGRLLLVDFEGNLHTVEELLLDISERVCGP